MAKHDRYCLCTKCIDRSIRQQARRQSNHFERNLRNGTTIYGPKSTEGRPGHRHGHRGNNFDRSPHSTIGSAAIGDPHTYEDHKKKRTKRW